MKTGAYAFMFVIFILLSILACSGQNGPVKSVSPTTSSSTPTLSSSTPSTAALSDMAAVVQDYYQAIQVHNYTKAYSYVQSDATTTDGQKLTLASLKQMATMIENTEGPIQNFTVAAFPADVVMTIMRQRMGPYHAHLQLKQAGNTWKIVSIDRI
jgi:hypothetical protein